MNKNSFLIYYFIFIVLLLIIQIFAFDLFSFNSEIGNRIEKVFNGNKPQIYNPISDGIYMQMIGFSPIHIVLVAAFVFFTFKNVKILDKKFRFFIIIVTILLVLVYPIYFKMQSGGLSGGLNERYSIITIVNIL